MEDSLYHRALMRAAEISGGVHALAERLGLDPGLLVVWMRGSDPVPPDVFVKVTDILLQRKGQFPSRPPEDAPPPGSTDIDEDPEAR